MHVNGKRGPWILALFIFSVAGSAAAQEPIAFRMNDLRKFTGTNLNWIYDGDGLRLSEVGQPSGLTDSLIRSLAYTAVRIPGGTLARHFPWRLAVDAPRGVDVDFSGKPQTISTGLPEFKRFAARYGFRVLYILNIDDPPSGIVELVNRWNRLEPLGQAPIQYVELGNEDYIYDGKAAGAERYSDVVLPIIRELRAAHPAVKIGAQLADPLGTGWDEVVYRRVANVVDFWTWHRYIPRAAYDSGSVYELTVDSMGAVDRDFGRRDELQKNRRLPIWLTEYNFMFYKNGTYENVALQPRFYLLMGDYLYLAVKHRLAAMFKCCLVNPGWQALVDIDFANTSRMNLFLSGQVSGLLNRWAVAQDSVAVVPEEGQPAMYRSVLAGRDSAGTVSFLIQNHTAQEQIVHLPVPAGYRWDSSTGLAQQGGGFREESPRPEGATTLPFVRAAPYSITIVRFRHASR